MTTQTLDAPSPATTTIAERLTPVLDAMQASAAHWEAAGTLNDPLSSIVPPTQPGDPSLIVIGVLDTSTTHLWTFQDIPREGVAHDLVLTGWAQTPERWQRPPDTDWWTTTFVVHQLKERIRWLVEEEDLR